MKQKLVALGAVLVFAAIFAARVPTASADPFASGLSVTLAQCGAGDPSCANPSDGIVQTGESVGTTVHTELSADGGSFYDAIRTVYTGVTPSTTVAAGKIVGSGTFLIQLSAGTVCSNASGEINPTYNIYATQDANSATYPSKGYAKGLTGTETWATFSAAGWVQDFDDDNNNNLPDFTETSGGGSSTLPMTVRDLNPANGIPDGADKEPLFLPLLDQITGQTHATRAFGDAVVIAGTLEVGVDFVTYTNFPAPGQNTQLAVIQEGAGLGLLPSNNSTATVSTCPPFTSDVTIFNKTSTGDLVQTASGSPITYQLQFSVAPDVDSDGKAGYQDNCDLVQNGPVAGPNNQTDTDLDGIGDVCDPAPATPAVADADGDGFPNYIDSCPLDKNTGDADSDGIDDGCDPAPSITGDGYGYAAPAPGQYHDHDEVDSASIALPFNIASNPTNGTGAAITDSNDNFIADGSENATTAIGTGVKPGDSDGDGTLDNADADPLDPGARSGKCGTDCDHVTGTARFLNMYGDGCNAADEATLSLGGNPLSTTSPWDYYDVPVPNVMTTTGDPLKYRTAGTLSAGMAQAVFGAFNANIKFPSALYNGDRNNNNVMDGVEYDRANGALPGAPDGVFSATEAQKAFSEFKANLKCASGGYLQNDSTWDHP